MPPADVVLFLHTHLPYVLHHGRWPHGSDWLCEAAIDAYLPLTGILRALDHAAVPAPITLGVTPVLAAQLASGAFRDELAHYFDQRLAACDEAPASLAASGDDHLVPLVDFWRRRLVSLRLLYHEIHRDLPAEWRRLQERGRLEVATSAATHAFLPLLACDESIRLQLVLARTESRRHFGRVAAGCWLPECGYRQAGTWAPLGERDPTMRPGLDGFLREAGFRYFFVDAHMAGAGRAPDAYGELLPGGTTRDASAATSGGDAHRVYRIGTASRAPLAALVRDPSASARVWSRHGGYPGAAPYLEFHKIRWPGGLRFWRVTDAGGGLGDKRPYEPEAARRKAAEHAGHYVRALAEEVRQARASAAVIAVPFDTELFGHWWFEGPDFLYDVFRELSSKTTLQPRTASACLDAHPPQVELQPMDGSWGRGGDYSMWLNERTRWMWRVLWDAESRFWGLAGTAHRHERSRVLLGQAARELLLLQASDWPFILTTGEAGDYACARFDRHANDLRVMLDAVQDSEQGLNVERAEEVARALGARDAIFDDVLSAVDQVLDARAPGTRPTRPPLA